MYVEHVYTIMWNAGEDLQHSAQWHDSMLNAQSASDIVRVLTVTVFCCCRGVVCRHFAALKWLLLCNACSCPHYTATHPVDTYLS